MNSEFATLDWNRKTKSKGTILPTFMRTPPTIILPHYVNLRAILVRHLCNGFWASREIDGRFCYPLSSDKIWFDFNEVWIFMIIKLFSRCEQSFFFFFFFGKFEFLSLICAKSNFRKLTCSIYGSQIQKLKKALCALVEEGFVYKLGIKKQKQIRLLVPTLRRCKERYFHLLEIIYQRTAVGTNLMSFLQLMNYIYRISQSKTSCATIGLSVFKFGSKVSPYKFKLNQLTWNKKSVLQVT